MPLNASNTLQYLKQPPDGLWRLMDAAADFRQGWGAMLLFNVSLKEGIEAIGLFLILGVGYFRPATLDEFAIDLAALIGSQTLPATLCSVALKFASLFGCHSREASIQLTRVHLLQLLMRILRGAGFPTD